MKTQIDDHGTQIWNSCKDIRNLRIDTDNILGTDKDFHNVLKGVEQAQEDLLDIHEQFERLRKAQAELKEKENERDCMEHGPIGRCVLARLHFKSIKNTVLALSSENQIRHYLRKTLPTQYRLLIDCIDQPTADALLRKYYDDEDCDPMKFHIIAAHIEKAIKDAIEKYQKEFDAGKRLIASPKKDSKKKKEH